MDSYRAVRRVRVDGGLTIVGDLHGKLGALEAVLAELGVEAGLAAGTHTLISLGDLVDRGPREERDGRVVYTGVEALVDRFAALERRYPDRVFAVLGNHEVMHLRDVKTRALAPGGVSRWGSQGELGLTAERLAWLRGLPIALELEAHGTRAVVVHAGVSERPFALDTLADVARIEDLVTRHDAERPLRELVWTNPTWSRGVSGFAFLYTRIHLAAFLEKNAAQVLIRGHHDEPEIRDLGGGKHFVCVHTAQGKTDRDVPADGYVYATWDGGRTPALVKR